MNKSDLRSAWLAGFQFATSERYKAQSFEEWYAGWYERKNEENRMTLASEIASANRFLHNQLKSISELFPGATVKELPRKETQS